MASSSRTDVLAALRACRLWHGADEASVARLAESAVAEDVPRGALLATEGEPAERLGVVVSGKVRVFHLGTDGRELTFETAGPGETFAAVAALAGGRYPAHAEAATPVTVAWLRREALFELMAAQPDVASAIVADLAGRVVHLTAVATTLSLEVPARVASYLFQRALAVGRTTPSGLLVELGMSKSELASSLGTVPETMSRALARLRDDGIIEVRAGDVLVKDVGALARLGSGYSEG
ncbi:MAG TPA: Crp/Fnr family transcriptional regulator [Coriobacteriia bacterium]